MTTDANLNPYEEIKNTGKGNYVKRHGGTLNASYQVKKPTWEGCIPYESNYVTFWRRQDTETLKRWVVAGEWEEMNRESTEGFQSNENILPDTVLRDTRHYTLFQTTECTTQEWTLRCTMDFGHLPCVSVGFILGNKCIILVNNVNNGEDYLHVCGR